MEFCTKCGNNLSMAAAFCGSCGAGVVFSKNPTVAGFVPSTGAAQEVSAAWKKTFVLLETAGGPKLPRARDLPFRDRMNVVANVFGVLFGPFYYLTKGMWKKAIVLTVLSIVVVVAADMVLDAMGIHDFMGLNFIASAIFGTRANIDYYKKMVLNDNGWW